MLFEAFSIDKVNPTHRLTTDQDINGEYNSASGQLCLQISCGSEGKLH